MRTVREMCQLTGVSVRTLHHYDAIGLLKPTQTTQAGYRLYDNAALTRLQNIVMFREVRFPLKVIIAMLDNPAFDPQEALEQQIKLLELQAQHIQQLIFLAREVQRKGVEHMDFHAFNKDALDHYADEVKARWGATQAYDEFVQKAEAIPQTNGTQLCRNCCPVSPHSEPCGNTTPVTPSCRKKYLICNLLSQAATITAPMRSSKVWGSCMSVTNV